MKIVNFFLLTLALVFEFIHSRDRYIEADYVKGNRECKRLGMVHVGYFNSGVCKADCCKEVKGCEGGCSQSTVKIPKKPEVENKKIFYYSRGVCCAKKGKRKLRKYSVRK